MTEIWCTVTNGGIKFRFKGEQFTYYNERMVGLVGMAMAVTFDPKHADSVSVRAVESGEQFAVQRLHPRNALNISGGNCGGAKIQIGDQVAVKVNR